MKPDTIASRTDIPSGLCQCGCGNPTPIATVTYRKRGWVKGQPIRFLVGHAMRKNPDHEAELFWAVVGKRGPDECWPFRPETRKAVYPIWRLAGKMDGAHRVAYRLAKGPIPDGAFICHTCDNPLCCNPAHLFQGTHQENMDDMKAKRRGRAPRGEDSCWAKLTAEQVVEARSLFRIRHPEFGYAGLARRYGVSATAMWEAINGETWNSV